MTTLLTVWACIATVWAILATLLYLAWRWAAAVRLDDMNFWKEVATDARRKQGQRTSVVRRQTEEA
jgi:hypothetical protein